MPPRRPSPKIAAKPSRLVALVCASVVAAYQRDWLSHPLTALRQADDPVPETLSRLKARLLADLERLVEKAHQRGRRSAIEKAELALLRAELACAKAQLELAASIISTRGIRDRALQQRIVVAAQDLRQRHLLFCVALVLMMSVLLARTSWPLGAPVTPPGHRT